MIFRASLFSLVCLVVLGLSSGSRAQQEDQLAASALQIVPADAAFFASWSHQREQIDVLRKSQAFQRLMQMPALRRAFGPLLGIEGESDDANVAELQQWLAQPSAQVALDGLSQEVFVYGDVSFLRLVEAAQEIGRINKRVRLEALAAGKTSQEADRICSRAACRELEKLSVPGLVVGLKLKDQQAAREQLVQLDNLVRLSLATEEAQPYRGLYGQQQIHGNRFLTVKLSGSMIPLHSLKFDEDADPQAVAAVKSAIAKLTLVLSIGMYEDYLILSLGDSTRHLQNLGNAKPLIDHADLARLRQRRNNLFTSIRYVSRQLRESIGARATELVGLSEFIAQSAQDNSYLSDETRTKLAAALTALQGDLQRNRPAARAMIGFTYLTTDGYEGFDYNSVTLNAEDQMPLNILNQVGGDPLFVRAGWSGISVAGYNRWIAQLDTAAIQLRGLVDQMDSSAALVWQQIEGYLRRLNEIMLNKILPSIVDGQAAFVVTAKDSSKQWHPEMPAAKTALRMPAAAIVMEINDRVRLVEGGREVYQLCQEMLQTGGQLATADAAAPTQVALPPAAVGRAADGTVYSLPLWTEQTGIAPGFLAPTAGISTKWLVLSTRQATAHRLLDKKPLVIRRATGTDDKSLAAFTHIDVEQLAGLALEWFNYSVELSPLTDNADDEEATLQLYRGCFDLLGCLRSYTALTYLEGETTVVHTIWRFEDR